MNEFPTNPSDRKRKIFSTSDDGLPDDTPVSETSNTSDPDSAVTQSTERKGNLAGFDEITIGSNNQTRAGEVENASDVIPSTPPDFLPIPVTEFDMDATRVTPAAYTYSPEPPPPPQPNLSIKTNDSTLKTSAESRSSKSGKKLSTPNLKKKTPLGCAVRLFIALLFLLVVAGLGAGSFLVFQFFRISSDLPSVDELLQHASQFETTTILDREGNSIYEIVDPNAGLRTYVSLEEVSPYVILATLATEDQNFFSNPGYDLMAMFRALWQNYTSGVIVSGASTITQQLARNLLLDPQERYLQSAERKAREIILASEITRLYSKDQILELYLNENNYANLAYGIEAAAELYFNRRASELTLGQAAFLAGIPQAPAVYDIFTNPEDTLHRTEQVMQLIYELVNERGGCVDIGAGRQPVCITDIDMQSAAIEIAQTNFSLPDNNMVYPHWVNYIRMLLENQYGSEALYRAGLRVLTTLDPSLQQTAEQIVQQQVSSLSQLNVQDGALVAIQPSTGEILAMVGSADFNNEAISGQINMALVPRQPGSSIKPLTYVAAFERGWTPSTLIWDVPTEFPPSNDPNDPNPPYIPVNYDGRFHGPVTVRTALANSFNIPAVRTLQYVGIYDDPNTPEQDGFLNFARRMGITTLNEEFYGLSLTLGGGEVTLLEMTGAFSILANNGVRIPPVAILRIEDFEGNIIFEYSPPTGDQVIRPEHAFLISDILSDTVARAPMFGTNSILNLPFPVAAKTGTTNDFRDNWTLGYTPDLAVGVWVGNADYTPMQNTTGVTGAAPIWSQFMQAAIMEITGGNPTPFTRPAGIVEEVICSISGTQPSEWCPQQRSELFAFDQLPISSSNDLWQEIQFDTWTGYQASDACQGYVDEVLGVNTTDSWAQNWLQTTSEGQNWATNNGFSLPLYFPPSRVCQSGDPRPEIVFVGLNDGDTITTSPLDIYAIVNATSNFSSFRLDYRTETSGWQNLTHSSSSFTSPENIYSWNLSGIPAGPVRLRIIIEGDEDRYAERQIRLILRMPTLTPTETPLPTETATPTTTETHTPTP